MHYKYILYMFNGNYIGYMYKQKWKNENMNFFFFKNKCKEKFIFPLKKKINK